MLARLALVNASAGYTRIWERLGRFSPLAGATRPAQGRPHWAHGDKLT